MYNLLRPSGVLPRLRLRRKSMPQCRHSAPGVHHGQRWRRAWRALRMPEVRRQKKGCAVGKLYTFGRGKRAASLTPCCFSVLPSPLFQRRDSANANGPAVAGHLPLWCASRRCVKSGDRAYARRVCPAAPQRAFAPILSTTGADGNSHLACIFERAAAQLSRPAAHQYAARQHLAGPG